MFFTPSKKGKKVVYKFVRVRKAKLYRFTGSGKITLEVFGNYSVEMV